ncbi:MAG: response regulator transcription factor [Bacteroidetes bacterium]|nr:response regulator transcription factor [Bacteroidota bacterium]
MKRLIVIDQDVEALNLINYCAVELKMDVYSSVDQLSAWEIEALRPDILFIDCALSRKDGACICAQLKSNAANKDLRIAVMSTLPQDKSSLTQQYADRYLRKPLDKQALQTTLHSLIIS